MVHFVETIKRTRLFCHVETIIFVITLKHQPLCFRP